MLKTKMAQCVEPYRRGRASQKSWNLTRWAVTAGVPGSLGGAVQPLKESETLTKGVVAGLGEVVG